MARTTSTDNISELVDRAGSFEPSAAPSIAPTDRTLALRMFVHFIAVGSAGGLGATSLEAVLFLFAPGRFGMPAQLPGALALTAAIYCGCGMLATVFVYVVLTFASWLIASRPESALPVPLSIPPSMHGRRFYVAHAAIALICYAGLSLNLGELLALIAPVATPLRRFIFLILGAGPVVLVWLLMYWLLRRSISRLMRWTRPLGGTAATCMIIALLIGFGFAVRDNGNQLVYFLAIAQGFGAPAAAVAVRPAWVGGRRGLNVLASIGLGLVVYMTVVGPSPQALYVLRIARALPGVIFRELPNLRGFKGEDVLQAKILAHFDPRGSGAEAPATLPPINGVARPNILLLTIDTLRRDVFFGDATHAGAMPDVTAFAASNATVFRSAFAASAATVPSMSQILSGRRDRELEHLNAKPGAVAQLAPTTPTIAERLRRAGYATHAVLGGGALAYFTSLGIGFEQVRDTDDAGDDWLEVEKVVAMVTHEVDTASGPWFVWGHVMDVHNHASVVGDPRENYEATVRRVDTELGKLLRHLGSDARFSNTLIIVTSDHGEGLGEGRMFAHGICHPLILWVPLIVRFPNSQPATSDATVGHLDLAPTILAAAGLSTADLIGRDLRDVHSPRAWPEDHAFHEYASYSNTVSATEIGVASYPWLLSYDIRTHLPVLIDLASDPNGRFNLAGQGRTQERALFEVLLRSFDERR